MKTIKQWWNERKAQAKEHEIDSIKRSFKVAERSGKLYLTHEGFAFAEIPCYTSAQEVATKLNEARNAAIEFEEL